MLGTLCHADGPGAAALCAMRYVLCLPQRDDATRPLQVDLDPAADSVAVMRDPEGNATDVVVAVVGCDATPDAEHTPIVSATAVPGEAGTVHAATVTADLSAAAAAGPARAVPASGLSMLAPPETFLGLASSEAACGTEDAGGGTACALRAVPCNEEQTAALQGTVRYVRGDDGAAWHASRNAHGHDVC